MAEAELQSDIILYYIDNETGQIYAEIGGKLYEMEIGDDVSEEAGMRIPDFEVLRVYDPTDIEECNDGLRIVSLPIELDEELDVSELME